MGVEVSLGFEGKGFLGGVAGLLESVETKVGAGEEVIRLGTLVGALVALDHDHE